MIFLLALVWTIFTKPSVATTYCLLFFCFTSGVQLVESFFHTKNCILRPKSMLRRKVKIWKCEFRCTKPKHYGQRGIKCKQFIRVCDASYVACWLIITLKNKRDCLTRCLLNKPVGSTTACFTNLAASYEQCLRGLFCSLIDIFCFVRSKEKKKLFKCVYQTVSSLKGIFSSHLFSSALSVPQTNTKQHQTV